MMDGRSAYGSSAFGSHGTDSGEIVIDIEDERSYTKRKNPKAWCPASELDSFYKRIYEYHQRHGFACMALEDVLQVILFVFMMCFCTFITVGVDYDILYQEGNNVTVKTSVSDVTLPWSRAKENFNTFVIILLVGSAIYLVYLLLRMMVNISKYWEMGLFYEKELDLKSDDLPNTSWKEIQNKLIGMLKTDELEIHHRIMRVKNYMIAMIDMSILPTKFKFPVIGESVFLTSGLMYNYEMILFGNLGGLFLNIENLKSKCHRQAGKFQLETELSNRITMFAMFNFFVMPLIFFWTLLHVCFENFALFRNDPSLAGSRTWSIYGRHYLRHYNELRHDFEIRLNKGYRPGKEYMMQFNSTVLAIIARFIISCSSVVLVLLLLSATVDEDTLSVKGILGCITTLTVLVAALSNLIPNKNMVIMPEKLLSRVLYYVHYIPENWIGQAHKERVRAEFGNLFQNKIVFLINELLSPILAPFILWLWLKPRSAKILEFFVTNSHRLGSLGNVCLQSTMDTKMLLYGKNREGMKKMELSLMNFCITNPEWKNKIVREEAKDATSSTCQSFATASVLSPASSLGGEGKSPSVNNVMTNSSIFFDENPLYHSMTMSQFDDSEAIHHIDLEGILSTGRNHHHLSMSIHQLLGERESELTSKEMGCHAVNHHMFRSTSLFIKNEQSASFKDFKDTLMSSYYKRLDQVMNK